MDKAALKQFLAAMTDAEFDELVSEARSDNSGELGQERTADAVRAYMRSH